MTSKKNTPFIEEIIKHYVKNHVNWSNDPSLAPASENERGGIIYKDGKDYRFQAYPFPGKSGSIDHEKGEKDIKDNIALGGNQSVIKNKVGSSHTHPIKKNSLLASLPSPHDISYHLSNIDSKYKVTVAATPRLIRIKKNGKFLNQYDSNPKAKSGTIWMLVGKNPVKMYSIDWYIQSYRGVSQENAKDFSKGLTFSNAKIWDVKLLKQKQRIGTKIKDTEISKPDQTIKNIREIKIGKSFTWVDVYRQEVPSGKEERKKYNRQVIYDLSANQLTKLKGKFHNSEYLKNNIATDTYYQYTLVKTLTKERFFSLIKTALDKAKVNSSNKKVAPNSPNNIRKTPSKSRLRNKTTTNPKGQKSGLLQKGINEQTKFAAGLWNDLKNGSKQQGKTSFLGTKNPFSFLSTIQQGTFKPDVNQGISKNRAGRKGIPNTFSTLMPDFPDMPGIGTRKAQASSGFQNQNDTYQFPDVGNPHPGVHGYDNDVSLSNHNSQPDPSSFAGTSAFEELPNQPDDNQMPPGYFEENLDKSKITDEETGGIGPDPGPQPSPPPPSPDPDNPDSNNSDPDGSTLPGPGPKPGPDESNSNSNSSSGSNSKSGGRKSSGSNSNSGSQKNPSPPSPPDNKDPLDPDDESRVDVGPYGRVTEYGKDGEVKEVYYLPGLPKKPKGGERTVHPDLDETSTDLTPEEKKRAIKNFFATRPIDRSPDEQEQPVLSVTANDIYNRTQGPIVRTNPYENNGIVPLSHEERKRAINNFFAPKPIDPDDSYGNNHPQELPSTMPDLPVSSTNPRTSGHRGTVSSGRYHQQVDG